MNPMSEQDYAEQERQWKAHAAKARAAGRCEFSGLSIHSCHRSICDCFDEWGCETCKAIEPPHDCATCQECIHDGNRCCGCYDGACCRE